ncbi:hypothetical protein BJ322DRAFT_255995 [Thelephora terrestris]|uniref:Uncharacterized protein n=1 Tax=Thelephora terrestris TaxID=56493 RepID=A0A9P6H7I4_9AGAM|nr:hypothetical protein BJ322DRAFT_255995 [Thelephora terrestris]
MVSISVLANFFRVSAFFFALGTCAHLSGFAGIVFGETVCQCLPHLWHSQPPSASPSIGFNTVWTAEGSSSTCGRQAKSIG